MSPIVETRLARLRSPGYMCRKCIDGVALLVAFPAKGPVAREGVFAHARVCIRYPLLLSSPFRRHECMSAGRMSRRRMRSRVKWTRARPRHDVGQRCTRNVVAQDPVDAKQPSASKNNFPPP